MKRTIDITAALLGIVLLSPLMLVVGLVVLFTMGKPVLFVQERAGWHGRTFRLYKFRTMTIDRDASGELLPDADRLTRAGAVIRRTSLDELPQLINVLRGEMSIVGPRPLLPEYLPLYTERQARRHDVRPGITGLSQVAGRNALSWEDRLSLDVEYVERRSLWLDASIVLQTVAVVSQQSDVAHPGSATMPKFSGSKNGDS
ncbi:MAG: sugar transferase [Actinomycetia bacterium]|nr:sugar transferase [Actinomycetes bacterium]